MKNFKGLAAAAAAGLISLSSMAAPVFAADEEVTFTTDVTSNKGLLTPAASTIEYEVVPADGAVYDENAEADTRFAGIEDAFTVSAAIRSTEDTAEDKNIDYTDSTISHNPNVKFPGPGVFEYTLKVKSTGSEAGNKGIEMNTTEIPMHVLVGYREGGQDLEVLGYSFGTTNKSIPAFVHVYNPTKLTVSKEVTGNQGNQTKPFTFTVTVKNAAGKDLSEDSSNTSSFGKVKNPDGSVTYTVGLTHGQNLVIDGLTSDDTYTVSENAEEYKPSYTVTQGDSKTAEGKTAATAEISVKDKVDETVAFTNTKDGTVPTGILMTAAPYVAVVGLGGAFAGMFFRRKRED